MKAYELFEVFDSSTPAKDLPDIAKGLMLDWKALAAKHELTIDGTIGRSAHDTLPMTRKGFMLFGGRIKVKGTMKQEAQRTVPLQERVRAFMNELWPTLKRLQAKALNNQLKTNYTVLVRVDDQVHDNFDDRRMFQPILKTPVDTCFRALRFKDALGTPISSPTAFPAQFAVFTWKLEINK